MELGRFLKKREKPPGSAPAKWLSAAKFKVFGGRLFVGDPHLDPVDAFVAKVPAGTYILEARLRDLGNEWWVSRVRARLEGIDEPQLGKQLGETSTDLAAFAFYDLAAAEEAIGGNNDRYLDLLFKQSFATCGVVQIKMKKPLTIAYVSTEFDCGAVVYELRRGRRRVGVEIEIDFEELEADLAGNAVEPAGLRPPPPLTQPAGFRNGTCVYCGGTGDCYCIRKKLAIGAACLRCQGSGKCHVCQGRGTSNSG